MDDEYKRFEIQYGIILVRTRRFGALMDRLGRLRISKAWGWALLYLMPVAAGLGLWVFLTNLAAFFSPSVHDIGNAVRALSPLSYLGLPGINPYLPIVDGWAALIFAMVVHEGAHGIVARSLGFPVKASGLLFFLFVPIGAFVEVDEDALKVAKARDSGRVLAAGAGVNFVVGILALLLLFTVVGTMTPAVNGVGVTNVVNQIDNKPCSPGACPAYQAGIRPGDMITTFDGMKFTSPTLIQHLEDNGSLRPGQVVALGIWRSGAVTNYSLTLAANPDNKSRAFIGLGQPLLDSTTLKATVSAYTGSFFVRPILYLCIPTFPQCQGLVPFSDTLSGFYASPYGGNLIALANFLYWFFFLNFNLAVFNALPIYPLDGGQAFRAGLKGLLGNRVSETGLSRISAGVTVAVLLVIISFPLAAYLGLV